MTNEQMANELGKKYETPCHGVGDCKFEAYQAAIETAKWKDEQFWSYENIERIITTYKSFPDRSCPGALIKMTIEKLKRLGL